MIEKAVKQVFHVYPFFNPDLLMFGNNFVKQLKEATTKDILN